MGRVNVYLPDSLATKAKAAGLNISRLTQDALESALRTDRTTSWLDTVRSLDPTGAQHEDVMKALDEARRDLGE